LSYTTFKYSDLHLSKSIIDKNQSTEVEVTVTNTGKYKGDEVVQLYIVHETINYAPLEALKGFKRITLDPGQSGKINFTLTPGLLSLIDNNGNSIFSPGRVKITVGGSSSEKRSEELGASKATEAILILK
jgi:beta-glucosidase